jgi:hypothetical protein
VRTIVDDAGRRWQVVLGKESWGTLVILFSPADGGDARTSVLSAETMQSASSELDSMTDDELLLRLRESRPWG